MKRQPQRSQRPDRTVFSPTRAAALGSAVLLVGAALLGWRLLSKDTRAPVTSKDGAEDGSQGLGPRRERPAFASSPRFVASSSPTDEDDGAAPGPDATPERRARHLLDMAVSRVLTEARMLASNIGIEAAGSSMTAYLHGAMSTLRDVDPALLAAMQGPLAERACSPGAEDVELMLFARVAMSAPEAASERGFSCAFTRHPQEDVLLWDLLDAWRHTGLPKTAHIAAIEAAAVDPRTKRRFLSNEETMARRGAAHSQAVASKSTPIPETQPHDQH